MLLWHWLNAICLVIYIPWVGKSLLDTSFGAFDGAFSFSFPRQDKITLNKLQLSRQAVEDVNSSGNFGRRSIRRADPRKNKFNKRSSIKQNGETFPRTRDGGLSKSSSSNKPVRAKKYDRSNRDLTSLSKQEMVLKLKESKSKYFQRQLLSRLIKSEAELKVYQYPIVLKYAGLCGDYEKLMYFYEQMEEKGKGSLFGYTSFMTACGKIGRYYEALGVFRKMQAEGMEIRKETYRCIICTLKIARQWYIALDLLKEMARDGLSDNPSFNAVMDTCIKCGEWPVAFGLLDEAQRSYGVKPDVVTFTSAISACASNSNLGQALFLFDRMQKEGVRPNVYTYSALISACEKKGNTKKALELLEMMQEEGVSPNVYTYSSAISACSKGKQFEKALVLFHDMRDLGIKPNAFTYSSMILACESLGPTGWKQSIELLESMRTEGIKPDNVCYHAAMQMCRDAGKTERVFELLRELLDVGLRPTEITYNIAISSCERDENTKRALSLVEEMESYGIAPSEYSFNSCICSAGSEYLVALGLLKEMLRRGLVPSAYTYTLVMTSCLKANKPQQAQKIIWEMKKNEVQVDTVCFNACLTACMRAENWQAALALAKEMEQFGEVDLDIISYNILLSACEKGRQPEMAERLFKDMLEDGVVPDVISYSTVIAAYEKAAMWEGALAMLDDMKQKGIEPNVYTYSSAISASEKGEQWRTALQLWYEMISKDIVPNVVTYSAIIVAMEKAGDIEKVDELYADGVSRGIFNHWNPSYPGMADFHDFTVPMSKAALRYIFKDILEGTSSHIQNKDLLLITGVGNNSKGGVSVIKPSLQKMLSTEFTPPIYALEASSNPGRLIITKENIQQWIKAQI